MTMKPVAPAEARRDDFKARNAYAPPEATVTGTGWSDEAA